MANRIELLQDVHVLARQHPQYRLIQEDVIDSLWLYVLAGCDPGSFLQAVLRRDLEAVALADEQNRDTIYEIWLYVYNELPGNCWGSRNRVAAWISQENENR